MDTLLIIEDDKRLGPTVQKGLCEEGYCALLSATGEAALEVLRKQSPALMVLDLGLPDCDGVELLQRIRQQGYREPVLILTARDRLTDKVQGLDAGADDYLAKPFAFVELLARLRALLRRSPSAARTLRAGDVTVDLVTRRAARGAETLDLTPREFDLFAYLAQHAGQVVSRDMLAKDVWREPSRLTPLDNVIDVHISRLRRKLTSPSGACPLQVVRGYGFKLEGAP